MIKNKIDYSGAGVYAILNEKNGKVYIGQSKNIKNRYNHHKNCLKNNIHACKELQNDCEDDMKFYVLHEMETDDKYILMILESLYIASFLEKGITLYNCDHDSRNFAESSIIKLLSDLQAYYDVNFHIKSFCKEFHTNMCELGKRKDRV